MSDELKVWWIPNPPREGFRYPVRSPEEAALILDVLSQYDLYLGEDIVAVNAGGLLINDDGEEWENEHCETIWEAFPDVSER